MKGKDITANCFYIQYAVKIQNECRLFVSIMQGEVINPLKGKKEVNYRVELEGEQGMLSSSEGYSNAARFTAMLRLDKKAYEFPLTLNITISALKRTAMEEPTGLLLLKTYCTDKDYQLVNLL